MPAFFLSHGGPTFMYKGQMGSDIGAYDNTKQIGKYIVETLRPEFILCVSAHWQSGNGANAVEVAIPSKADDENPLIYDFYGFPKHMYQEKFATKASTTLANEIVHHLKESGFQAKTTIRGIDHGVWVPFKVAFGDSLDIPLLQVSLPGSESIESNIMLGKALRRFRQNGAVVFSGMSVHNLRDMMINGFDRPLPYAKPFNQQLKAALMKSNSDDRIESLQKLMQGPLFRQAHPTPEHFLPLVAGVGSSFHEDIHEIYSGETGSLGWSIYRYGSLPTESKA